MHSKKRNVLCLLLALIMCFSSVACSKKSESSACVENAEAVLDALISLNTKKLKKLGDFPDITYETISAFESAEFSEAIALSSYEIDKDSVEEKKRAASCTAIVTHPDYTLAAKNLESDDITGLRKAFSKEIQDQSKKKYKEIEITLQFDIEDGKYMLSNPKEVADLFFSPLVKALQTLAESDSTSETTKATTKPSETKAVSDFYPFTMDRIKCVEINEDVFTSVLKKVDSVAADNIQSSDVSQLQGKLTKYLSAGSEDVVYAYYEYPTSTEARNEFTTLSSLAQNVGPYYLLEATWGFSALQSNSMTNLMYYSGNAIIMGGSTVSDRKAIGTLEKFFEELAGENASSVTSSKSDSSSVVYEDSRVIISYIGVDSKGVHFEVKNLTDATVTIQAESVAINKISTDSIIMSDKVAPQSTGEVVAKCSVDYKSKVGTVSGMLRVIDFDKSFDSYPAIFDVVIDESVTPELKATGTLLYEDSRAKVYFKSIEPKGVALEVENLTDANMTIQADSIAINRLSMNDILFSASVAPHSLGTVIAKCSVGNNIVAGSFSGELRIIDFNKSFKSYNVVVDNVIIDENVDTSVKASGVELYSDAKVKIYFIEATSTFVSFEVENLTGSNITIQADSIAINDKSVTDIIMSDAVAPHSIGIVTAKCSTQLNGSVTTVSGKLRVIDFNKSFKSYNAKFSKVSVSDG